MPASFFSSYYTIFGLLCLFGAIICLIPITFSTFTKPNEPLLRMALTTQRVRDSSVAVIALTLPVAIEIGAETLNYVLRKEKSGKIENHVKPGLLNTLERFILVCGMLTMPLTTFFAGDVPDLVTIYECLRKFRIMIVGAAIMMSLCRYDKKYWPVRKIFVSMIFLVVANISGVFIDASSRPHDSTISRKEQVKERMENQRAKSSTTPMIFPLLYVTSTNAMSIILAVTASAYPAINAYDPSATFYYNTGYAIFLLITIHISDRMIKYEVLQRLYALIESKKMYVRYISHELRTPLNSAFLGLKLISDDLQASADGKNSEHFETLLDVQSACRIAVEILNDLLCFDKLESGILEVHRHEVPVVPFIAECVDMFVSQAKEGGVTIYNVTPQGPQGGLDLSTPLLEGDTVFMDKFKMDQVLRNLISNALKFTLRGGSVSVCASFVPTNGITPPTLPASQTADTSPPHSSSPIEFVSRSVSDSFLRIGTCLRIGSKVHVVDIESGDPNVIFPHSNGAPNSHKVVSIKSECKDDDGDAHRSIPGKLRIVVTDTGAGISKSNQLRLFDEIVQFNPEVLQAGGGSGLGLWITSSIVHMHSGSISVYSAGAGKGSTFTVEVGMERRPVYQPAAVPLEGPSDALAVPLVPTSVRLGSDLGDSGVKVHPNIPAYDVLVVDDSSLNRKLLCKLFRNAGYTCEEADDGLSAVERVKERMARGEGVESCYDAILMDFVMPNMDGPTATHVIRGLGYTALIFGVTGNSLDSDVNHFLSSGVNAVLEKPFDFAHFQQLMREQRPFSVETAVTKTPDGTERK